MSLDTPLHFAPVEIRPAERRVLVRGQAVTLGSRAYDLLLVLVERRERVVTKAELLDLVWPNLVVEESNLPVHVLALRKALGSEAIATIPGRGYRFTLASSEAPVAAPTTAGGGSTTAPAPATTPAASTPPAAPPAAPPQASKTAPEALAPGATPAAALPPLGGELIGREAEVAALRQLLAEHRLVTLVGTGGLGKTRLALALSHGLAAGSPLGGSTATPAAAELLPAPQPCWVDLSGTRAGEPVLQRVAQVLGAALGEGDGTAQLARALAARPPTLLVLDNCEQVAEGVAALAEGLLAQVPTLRLLCTSQQPLHLAAEQVWRLDALAVPAPGASLAEARRCGAFALFEQRAQAADQRFRLDEASLPLAIELCRRLDGHALALEMAAARAPQIGLAALSARLGDRLKLLRASQHGQPARQASLRATLDWSCSLLSEAERVVLRRLAVFAGSFGLDSAQAVAADAEDAEPAAPGGTVAPAVPLAEPLDEWAVLDAMTALVDHGLLKVEAGDPPRYRLAETTRLYGLEALAAAGEAAATRQRHRRALARLAAATGAQLWTLRHDAVLARHAADQDDLRAAFVDAAAAGDAASSADCGLLLALLDHLRGILTATRERMAAAQALLQVGGAGLALPVRAALLDLLAPVSSIALPGLDRLAVAQARVQAWRTADDPRCPQRLYLALLALAGEQARAGQAEAALATAAELAALETQAAEPFPAGLLIEGAQVAFELARYGVRLPVAGNGVGAEGVEAVAMAQLAPGPASPPATKAKKATPGSPAAASASTSASPTPLRASALGLQRALALAEVLGDARRIGRLRFLLADEATGQGEGPAALAEAVALGQAAVAAQQPLLRPATLGMAWSNLCAAQLLAGDDAGARASAAQALPLLRPNLYANVLFNHLALLAARAGQAERGARLLGHADRWYAANRSPRRQRVEARTLALALPALQAALGEARCEALRAEGATLDDAAADALAAALLAG